MRDADTGSHFQSAVLPRAVRELSDAEKTSLARSLPVNFNDPDWAKFRWLPVSYEPGSAQVEYLRPGQCEELIRRLRRVWGIPCDLQADPRRQCAERNHRSPQVRA